MLKRKNRQRSRECLAQTGLVGLAVSREQMRRHMIDFAIELYVTDDGAQAGQLLGHLAWVLAIGAEIAAQTAPGSHTARSVHAALRTVLTMSAAGNRWQAAQAGVLHQAASDAQALMAAHPVQPQDLRESAEWLASRVQAGTATLADVAGSEIYAVAAGDVSAKTIADSAYSESTRSRFEGKNMKTVTIYLAARPCFPALGYRDETGALRIGQPGEDCSRPLAAHEVARVVAELPDRNSPVDWGIRPLQTIGVPFGIAIKNRATNACSETV